MEKEKGNDADTSLTVTPQREVWNRLEAIDAGKIEERQVDMEKSRNLLKLRDVLKSAEEVRRVFIEEIAGDDGVPPYVEYCALNTGETIEVSGFTDPDERLQRELFLRVRKADPEVKQDDIYGLPAYLIKLIMIKIREQEDYRFLLPALQRNLTILRQIQTRSGSGNSVTDSIEHQAS